jgi:putative membrane protein insertion efficiency factor
MGLLKKLLVFLIRLYQKWLSPLKKPCCRFYPSCSQYAVDAVMKYGCVKGCFLAFKRILKCHPFNPGGYDPVR